MKAPAPGPDPVLTAAAAGGESARRTLLDRHGGLVWGLCRRFSPDAEDDYQEVWEKVFRALGRFDPNGPATLSTWIATIAHRHLVDRHRRRKVRGEVVPLGDIPAHDGVDERIDGQRRAERLEAALARLPVDMRTVIVMHHLNGVPLEDIAAAEGVAVGTVKSRLHRGRARLLELLGGVP
jgi:RNA polymerase sigma-70 factor (ECF subfamily)